MNSSIRNDSRLIYLLAEIQTERDNGALALSKRVTELLDFLSAHVEDVQVMQQLEALDNRTAEKLSEQLAEPVLEVLCEMHEEIGAVICELEDYGIQRANTKDVIEKLLGGKDVLSMQKSLLTGQEHLPVVGKK